MVLSPVLYILNVIFSLIELVLGLRVALKLFGAANSAPFVGWLYNVTASLIAPFSGIFPQAALSGNSVIDFTALFALLFYTFVGYVLVEAIRQLTYRGNGKTGITEIE